MESWSPTTRCATTSPRRASWVSRFSRPSRTWAPRGPFGPWFGAPPLHRQTRCGGLSGFPSYRARRPAGPAGPAHRVLPPERVAGDALVAVVDGQGADRTRRPRASPGRPPVPAKTLVGLGLVECPGNPAGPAEECLHHELQSDEPTEVHLGWPKRGEVPIEDRPYAPFRVEDEVAAAYVAQSTTASARRPVTGAPLERLGQRRQRVALGRPRARRSSSGRTTHRGPSGSGS